MGKSEDGYIKILGFVLLKIFLLEQIQNKSRSLLEHCSKKLDYK